MDARRSALGVLILFAVTGLWGCPPPGEPADNPAEEVERWEPTDREREPGAQAEMVTALGERAGIITFTAVENAGVAVRGVIEVPGLSPGPKGFHVHEVGVCEPPTFESAGDHFDPHEHPHGSRGDAPEQRHTGDFGNVELRADERAEIDFVDRVITLGMGANDILGRALILHEGEDDLTTQPDGDAGDRVACGVVEWVDLDQAGV